VPKRLPGVEEVVPGVPPKENLGGSLGITAIATGCARVR
jgi:hypothetical protein